jgi:hypothetical protein
VVIVVTRSATILAGGSASAAKFFVAALAFTGAYAGLSAYGTANSAPAPARTLTLAAREIPVTAATARAATPGRITLSTLDTAPGCLKTFMARTVIVNPDPDQTVSYAWRLTRWSPAANTWRTYLVHYSGFAGAEEPVEWDPSVAANPGWYRVELRAEGLKTVKSDRFQVSC